MFCKTCGKELNDDASFCNNCGTPIGQVVTSNVSIKDDKKKEDNVVRLEIEPTFVIPQMYYFIDESNLLSYLEQNLFPQGDLISNDFLEITSDMVCRY